MRGWLGRLPLGEPGVQLGAGRDSVGHLERHAAGRMGSERREGEIAEGRPLEIRDVRAHLVVKREEAVVLGPSGERHGEELADGAELEQRIGRHRRAGLGVRQTGGEDEGLAVHDHAHGEARNLVLGHDRLEHARGDALEARLVQRHGRQDRRERRDGKQGKPVHTNLASFVWCRRVGVDAGLLPQVVWRPDRPESHVDDPSAIDFRCYAPGAVRISGPWRVATTVCSYWTVGALGRL